MVPKNNQIKTLMSCLLLAALLSPAFLTSVNGQSSGLTVGEWPLDEVKPSGSNVVTPDVSGYNYGIIGGDAHPELVESKFGKAMQFNGENFVYVAVKFVVGFPPMSELMYVPISPGLDIQKYVEIDAWIKVAGYTDEPYNNIVVKCDHPDQKCEWQNTLRVLGLSIRANPTEAGNGYVEGALSGFVMTDTDGFNEIVTNEPLPLNQWVNVKFTRTSTGMHLYIDGQEQVVKVLEGIQNPKGNLVNGTEYYFGHDGLATIDNVRIIDLEPADITEDAFDIGPNITLTVIVVAAIFAVAWLLRRAIQLWIIKPKI